MNKIGNVRPANVMAAVALCAASVFSSGVSAQDFASVSPVAATNDQSSYTESAPSTPSAPSGLKKIACDNKALVTLAATLFASPAGGVVANRELEGSCKTAANVAKNKSGEPVNQSASVVGNVVNNTQYAQVSNSEIAPQVSARNIADGAQAVGQKVGETFLGAIEGIKGFGARLSAQRTQSAENKPSAPSQSEPSNNSFGMN